MTYTIGNWNVRFDCLFKVVGYLTDQNAGSSIEHAHANLADARLIDCLNIIDKPSQGLLKRVYDELIGVT